MHGFSRKVRQETSSASLGQPKAPSLGRPGPSLWPTGIGYGGRGEGRTPTHDIQQQGARGIAKYASFLPPWRFLSRLHGRRCRADAALLLLERGNLGAVGLAVDLRLPRVFVCQTRRGRRQFVAFASMVSNTGSSSPGDLDMTCSTSDVAVCCSSDSESSRVRCCSASN